MNRTSIILRCLLGGPFLALLLLPASAPAAAGKSSRKLPPGDALFSDGRIRTFKIEVAEPALDALQKENRSYVRGLVREGDRVFRDVGVHL